MLHPYLLARLSRRSRRTAAVLAFVCSAALCLDAASVRAQETLPGIDFNEAERMLDMNVVELRLQLRNGLRVFLPEQEAFLETVLAQVQAGRLPRSMVNMVYVWAKRRNAKVPFPYFEFALRALADRRGVTL